MSPPVPTNCHACNYSLAGIDRPTCPECGADITPKGFVDSERRIERRNSIWAWVLAAGGVLIAGAMTYPRASIDSITQFITGWILCAAFLAPAFIRLLRHRNVWWALGLGIVLGIFAPLLLTLLWGAIWTVVLRIVNRIS